MVVRLTVKFDHNAGHEDTPDDESYVRATGHPAYRADDALWLFPTVYKYIAESGNTDFIDEVILFANGGKGTVYEHLKRAIDFSMNHLGNNRMPAGLHADWNDCLRLGKQGESTFVAMQLYYAILFVLQMVTFGQQLLIDVSNLQIQKGILAMTSRQSAGKMTAISVDTRKM